MIDRSTDRSIDGLAVVDKPAGLTSHDVVAQARRILGTRKVGHAGTLDPMATGVLVLGVGRGTKLLTFLVGADKTYRAAIRLGAATTTDDAEGELVTRADAAAVTDAAIAAGVAALTGSIEQVPSSVSAIKVDGKRAYARVRAGEEVSLAARPVTVHRFVVDAVRRLVDPLDDHGGALIDLDVEVDCSSGTYVRALARDLGAALGVGGHLTALRRTRVGPFGIDRALSLDQLRASASLLSLADAARAILPVREVTDAEAHDLRHGRGVNAIGAGPAPTAAIDPGGALLAVIVESGPRCRPLLVLDPR